MELVENILLHVNVENILLHVKNLKENAKHIEL